MNNDIEVDVDYNDGLLQISVPKKKELNKMKNKIKIYELRRRRIERHISRASLKHLEAEEASRIMPLLASLMTRENWIDFEKPIRQRHMSPRK